ncbi:MAG: hypothetical protein ACKPJN_01300, partial [Microcystis panniformis]
LTIGNSTNFVHRTKLHKNLTLLSFSPFSFPLTRPVITKEPPAVSPERTKERVRYKDKDMEKSR